MSNPQRTNEANKAAAHLETNLTLHQARTDRGGGYELWGGSREKTSQCYFFPWPEKSIQLSCELHGKERPRNTHRGSLVIILAGFFFFYTSREESASSCLWVKWKGQKDSEGRCFYCTSYMVHLFSIWDWQHKLCMLIHMLSLFPWIFNTAATMRDITWGFTLSNNNGEVLSALPVSLFPRLP